MGNMTLWSQVKVNGEVRKIIFFCEVLYAHNTSDNALC